jgi:hypothetical protein
MDPKGGEANSCFSPVLYKARDAIERMFCQLKVFRRLATRYDKLAANFLASIHLAAALTGRLSVLPLGSDSRLAKVVLRAIVQPDNREIDRHSIRHPSQVGSE